jgi:hypothetical protein
MHFVSEIAYNGSRIGEGAEKKAQTFNFDPTLAKPFFYLLIYTFSAKKNGFAE